MATVVSEMPAAQNAEIVVIKPQLDLSMKSLYAPTIKYRRIVQQNGGTNLTLTSGVTNSMFQIPSVAHYPSMSYVGFDLTSAAPAANNASVFTDMTPINDITYSLSDGRILGNLLNVGIYSKHVSPLFYDMNEYLTAESVLGAATVGAAYSQCNFLQPAQDAQGTSAVYVANAITSQYVPNAGTSLSVIPASAVSGVNNPYVAQQRIVTGAATTAHNVKCKIPFSHMAGTLLGDPRLQFYNQQTLININYLESTKWGFECKTDGTSYLPATCTISNYYLYLAVEVNSDNVKMIQDRVNNGLEIIAPYTICNRLNVAASGSVTMNSTLSSGFGVLKRACTVACHNTETLQLTGNSDNVASVKWASVQSYYQNVPLQDFALSVANNEPFNYLEPIISGTVMGISSRNYNISPVWVDNFSDCDSGHKWRENDSQDSGKLIMGSENYAVQYNTVPAALKLYQFLTFGRRLRITPSTIQWL
jgi:hypothetical protein